ncbi:MAG: type VII secretion protein EccB, partial [Streptosporangiaceae bacterium]
VMVAAVFGIWGLIDPGGAQGLDTPGTLIIDSQSATSYIWCDHGKLCPVVNYASARLALNTDTPNQRTVSQASLASYPRGPLIGIPGLPQPLPDPSMLTGSPWSVCVRAVASAATGQQHTVTTLVGGHSVGGRAVRGGKALVVQANGSDWLIWDGQRLAIPAATQRNVMFALGTSQQPETMPLAWLNAFPEGSNFAAPVIPGYGRPVTAPQGGRPAKVGQVFAISGEAGAAARYDVMLSDGKLAAITQTQARLLDAAPGQVPQGQVNPSVAAGDSAPAGSEPTGGLPTTMPQVIGYAPATPLCVVYTSTATVAPSGPQVTVGGTVPSATMATNGTDGVDQIALPPGTAALVGVLAGTQSGSAGSGQSPLVSSYFLITGGLRYGLASPSVAGVLGYTLPGQRTLLPAGVAELIPPGPAFDPSKAERQVAG